MDLENNTTNEETQNHEVEETKARRNPINYILIGLIVVLVGLLVFQFVKMNKVEDYSDDLLNGEDNVTIIEPTVVELSEELFDSESMLLDFSDITLNIETEDIRQYYETLVNDMSNFTKVQDVTFIPSDNIFELRFKETSTSIFFFNKTTENGVYCSVMHKGSIVGNYLVPVVYYGNLFNIVQSSADVTNYTHNIVKENIPSLIENANDIAVKINDSNEVENSLFIETFESQVKNLETSTVVFGLPDQQYVIVCYMNFKYHVFLTDVNGEVLSSGSYDHYEMWDNNRIACYNGDYDTPTENIVVNEDTFYLKVVKE